VTSPFDPRAAVAENALAVRGRFPVSEGHMLVMPRREPVATWFHATRDEQLAILELVDVQSKQASARFVTSVAPPCFTAMTWSGSCGKNASSWASKQYSQHEAPRSCTSRRRTRGSAESLRVASRARLDELHELFELAETLEFLPVLFGEGTGLALFEKLASSGLGLSGWSKGEHRACTAPSSKEVDHFVVDLLGRTHASIVAQGCAV